MIRELTITAHEDGSVECKSSGCTLIDIIGMAEYAAAVARYDLLSGVEAARKEKKEEPRG